MKSFSESLLLLLTLLESSSGQTPCATCEYVVQTLFSHLSQNTSSQEALIEATVCPSQATELYDCISATETFWPSVIERLSFEAADPLCQEFLTCSDASLTPWNCQVCQRDLEAIANVTHVQTYISSLQQNLLSEAFCATTVDCSTFVTSALPPALRILGEVLRADARRICDESFYGICAAVAGCAHKTESLLEYVSQQAQIEGQKAALKKGACTQYETIDQAIRCADAVEEYWDEAALAFFEMPDLALAICTNMAVDFLPPEQWDILTCERELEKVALLWKEPGNVQLTVDYLQGDAFCGADNLGLPVPEEDCAVYIEDFIPSAVPVLINFLQERKAAICLELLTTKKGSS